MPVNFDDLTNRILDRLDEFEKKFDVTCANISEMKTDLLLLTSKVNSHLDERKTKAINNEKRMYGVIAILGITFSAITIAGRFL